MSNHIIHKQEVILNVESIDNAFDYQNTVSNLFANGLTALIEKALDEADTQGTVTRINKLELDLGEISTASFNNDFKERLIQQLKDSLLTIHNKKDIDISVTKKSQSIKEGFIYFIENGRLPWYIQAKDIAAFETLIFDGWNETDWKQITDWLQQNAPFNYSIIERLAWQFSSEFHKQIIAVVLNVNIEDNTWQSLSDDLKLIYNRFELTKASPAIKMFDLIFNQDKYFSLNELIATQLHDVFSTATNQLSADEQNILAGELKTNLVTIIVKNFYLADEKQISLKQIDPKELLQIDEMRLKATTVPDEEELAVVKKDEALPKKQKAIKKDEAEDVLFVDNCGIVLLHPFLQSYFDGLLLTENRKFISDEAQKRAALLLYYLCTGLTEVAEFNLILQKVLCGLNLEESLPSTIILLQDEIDESEKLLQSVINYWPPLKNTSIEGLRTTFLQRKGKLANTYTGWQLTVEQKTVDILINKLPWGFSTIQLPWMNSVLNVEWY